MSIYMLPFCIVNCYKSWHRYVFRYSYPYPIVISKAFHHAVRKGMLCLDLDEDTKKKNHVCENCICGSK